MIYILKNKSQWSIRFRRETIVTCAMATFVCQRKFLISFISLPRGWYTCRKLSARGITIDCEIVSKLALKSNTIFFLTIEQIKILLHVGISLTQLSLLTFFYPVSQVPVKGLKLHYSNLSYCQFVFFLHFQFFLTLAHLEPWSKDTQFMTPTSHRALKVNIGFTLTCQPP